MHHDAMKVPLLQASVYLDRAALWVLPDEMYGKYVRGHNPIFGHLHGSTWHGEDAKSILWFLHHPLFLVLMGAALAGGGLLWACAVCRLKALRGANGSQLRYVPLGEVITLKSS